MMDLQNQKTLNMDDFYDAIPVPFISCASETSQVLSRAYYNNIIIACAFSIYYILSRIFYLLAIVQFVSTQ